MPSRDRTLLEVADPGGGRGGDVGAGAPGGTGTPPPELFNPALRAGTAPGTGGGVMISPRCSGSRLRGPGCSSGRPSTSERGNVIVRCRARRVNCFVSEKGCGDSLQKGRQVARAQPLGGDGPRPGRTSPGAEWPGFREFRRYSRTARPEWEAGSRSGPRHPGRWLHVRAGRQAATGGCAVVPEPCLGGQVS